MERHKQSNFRDHKSLLHQDHTYLVSPLYFCPSIYCYSSTQTNNTTQETTLPFLLSSTHMGNYSGSSSSSSQMEELHVLAVDDSVIDRKLVEKLLKKSAYRVTTAENGIKALEFLGLSDDQQSNIVSKVNLIITDYCMPEMTGYELLKKIKESSAMKGIPVVIMSSENVPTRINKCLEEGAQMFMLKPLKQSDVRRLKEVI